MNEKIKNLIKRPVSIVEAVIFLIFVCVISCAVLFIIKIREEKKIKAIIVESVAYRNAIMNFDNHYLELPGNMSNEMLKKHFLEASHLVNNCTIAKNRSNIIDKITSPESSNCAFYQLQMSRFANIQVDAHRSLIKIVKTNITNPSVIHNDDLAWHVVHSNIGGDDTVLPIETSMPGGYLSANGYDSKLMIVITKSSNTGYSGKYAIFPKLNMADNHVAGISARTAMKIDRKIDTGSPYSGRLISGRDGVDAINGSRNAGCTVVVEKFGPKAINTSAKYNTEDPNALCIVAFVIEMPQKRI